jgi:hypothetical protein
MPLLGTAEVPDAVDPYHKFQRQLPSVRTDRRSHALMLQYGETVIRWRATFHTYKQCTHAGFLDFSALMHYYKPDFEPDHRPPTPLTAGNTGGPLRGTLTISRAFYTGESA